jgi:hypothetical protein
LSIVINKLKEFYTKLQKTDGALLPAWRQTYGENRQVTFNDTITAYTSDPSLKAFVDFLADQTVGAGFYTTVNEDYPQATEAKQTVDTFNETVNLDELLQIATREIVASGNSFWLKTEPDNLQTLKILPLTGFDNPKAITRNQYGQVTNYNYTYGEIKTTFTPEKIIHYRWNPTNFSPYGTGILQVLLTTLTINGETRASYLEMKARIEKIMPEIFEKYAGPDELWIFAGATDEKLAEYQKLIKTKPKAGARFVYNKPEADIKTVTTDPRARYEAYINHILNQIYLGGQTPLPKLFTTPGFTEASANAALNIAERKIMALQRFIKRKIEHHIFNPLIQQAGHDPKKANIRLNWGTEKPKTKLEDLIRLAELSTNTQTPYIRPEEVRKNLIKAGFELWENQQ